MASNDLRNLEKTPVFVEEDHHDVLPHIFRYEKLLRNYIFVYTYSCGTFGSKGLSRLKFILIGTRLFCTCLEQISPGLYGQKNMKILKVAFFQLFLIPWLWGIQAVIIATFKGF